MTHPSQLHDMEDAEPVFNYLEWAALMGVKTEDGVASALSHAGIALRGALMPSSVGWSRGGVYSHAQQTVGFLAQILSTMESRLTLELVGDEVQVTVRSDR